jgi:hypothetical protein
MATQAQIVTAAIDGVIAAQKAYTEWSGEWLWMAPEYLATVHVGKAIVETVGQCQVTLEHGTHSAIKDAGAKGRGRLHSHIRESGRFDILLWTKDGMPKAPIEIKVQVTNSRKIMADVHRIEKVLIRKKDTSSFSFGMIVYYISLVDSAKGKSSARDKIETRNSEILKDVREEIGATCLVTNEVSEIFSENDSAWAAVVLMIKPKNLG